MMDITCDGPSYIYGDNKSVLCNTSIPDYTFKNNYQSIEYQLVHEGVERDR